MNDIEIQFLNLRNELLIKCLQLTVSIIKWVKTNTTLSIVDQHKGFMIKLERDIQFQLDFETFKVDLTITDVCLDSIIDACISIKEKDSINNEIKKGFNIAVQTVLKNTDIQKLFEFLRNQPLIRSICFINSKTGFDHKELVYMVHQNNKNNGIEKDIELYTNLLNQLRSKDPFFLSKLLQIYR